MTTSRTPRPARAGSVNGSSITSTLGGKNYFTVAVLPTKAADTDSTRTALADLVRSVRPRARHRDQDQLRLRRRHRQGEHHLRASPPRPGRAPRPRPWSSLYPHQWKDLAGGSPIGQTYVSPRGQMKNLVGVTSFATSMTYHGILPELPAVATSAGADRATLVDYLNQVADDPAGEQKPDTYWAGKGLGRSARIAEIADLVGETATRDKALTAMKSDPGELAHRLVRRDRPPLLLRPELGDPDRLRRQLRVRPGAQRSPLPLRLLHRRGGHGGQVRPGLGRRPASTAA